MTRWIALLALAALAACSTAPQQSVVERRVPAGESLPPMKNFSNVRVKTPTRSNRSIAADILDLTFQLESGRQLPVLTRFEGPITVRTRGPATRQLQADLDRLLARLRTEARVPINRVAQNEAANITIEVIPRAELQRAVPQAACFVVPRMTSWEDFRKNRRSPHLDWTTLRTREKMAVFIPGDVSPQEVRDCLHEELAQAIGPLNDLYRLSDSVFNDDNFHTVLTGFDMLVLRVIYAPELRSGMKRPEVAAKLPGILDRINPSGRNTRDGASGATPRAWINAIEVALGPRTPPGRRRAAARQAVQISQQQGWNDTRTAFSLYALGRLSIGSEPETAMAAFLQSGSLYRSSTDTDVQAAHVAMQLAAFALSAGQPEVAIDIVDANVEPVARAENAALLSTLLMVKAESLDLLGEEAESTRVRNDAIGWARYGYGYDGEVRARLAEIAALTPRRRTRS